MTVVLWIMIAKIIRYLKRQRSEKVHTKRRPL